MKNLKAHIVLFILCVASSGLQAQNTSHSLGPWVLNDLSGELSLTGLHQQQNNYFNEIYDEQQSSYLIGGLKLASSSFLWKPDIISIDLSGEYNPETRQEKYLSIPDRSEVRTLKKVDLRTTIFSDKALNLNSWFNYDQNYFNRENLTNIKSNNINWGSLLSFNNKFLPLTIRYRNIAWDQTETESGRVFKMKQNGLEARASKSFFGSDKHDLLYSYDDYYYSNADFSSVSNTVNRLTLNNRLFFKNNKDYGFRSHISFYDQNGSHKFNKTDIAERFVFHLPLNLDLSAGYYFYRMKDPNQLLITNRVRSSIQHKLFESLRSEIFEEYSGTTHTIYQENNFKTGANIRYTKKIPFGTLNLGYNYYRHHNTIESEQANIFIVDEPHSLNDLSGIYLEKPYANINSVLITDLSNTIIYSEGLDYLLTEVNDFIEVVRVPGGQIAQDQDVLISYTAIQPGSYHYEANNHAFNTGLLLFGQFLNIYYKHSQQSFVNVEEAEFLTLNTYIQNVLGAKFYYKFITGGLEYDYYNSSIIPYKRINYFLNLNFKLTQKLIFSANGNYRDYILIDTEVNHRYLNLSGRLAYRLSERTELNLQMGYLDQRGRNIDLDLLTGRLEFAGSYRKLYLKTGLTLYKRTYINNEFTYLRTHIQLARKF